VLAVDLDIVSDYILELSAGVALAFACSVASTFRSCRVVLALELIIADLLSSFFLLFFCLLFCHSFVPCWRRSDFRDGSVVRLSIKIR
jgi:hypothetical protein